MNEEANSEKLEQNLFCKQINVFPIVVSSSYSYDMEYNL